MRTPEQRTGQGDGQGQGPGILPGEWTPALGVDVPGAEAIAAAAGPSPARHLCQEGGPAWCWISSITVILQPCILDTMAGTLGLCFSVSFPWEAVKRIGAASDTWVTSQGPLRDYLVGSCLLTRGLFSFVAQLAGLISKVASCRGLAVTASGTSASSSCLRSAPLASLNVTCASQTTPCSLFCSHPPLLGVKYSRQRPPSRSLWWVASPRPSRLSHCLHTHVSAVVLSLA